MGERLQVSRIQTGAAVGQFKMLLRIWRKTEAALALFAGKLRRLSFGRTTPSCLLPFFGRASAAKAVFGDGIRRWSFAVDILADVRWRSEALVSDAAHRLGPPGAHERGIIHRDVSPDNIIRSAGDVTRAKIIDFGIARSTQLADKPLSLRLCRQGQLCSPEQVALRR